MKFLTSASFILLIFFLISCAGTPNKQSSPPPKWIHQTGFNQTGTSVTVVGRSFGISEKNNAETAAFINALSEISSYFGVRIKSETIDVSEESGGVYSYKIGTKNKITGTPIKLNRFNKVAIYTEENEKGYSSYCLIKVPIEEIARIEKEIKGITDWSVLSSADFKTELVDFIKEFSHKKELKIAPDETKISENSIKSISQISESAYFLSLQAENTEPVLEGKVWITRVKIRLRLLSLTEEKELDTITEELKWGELTPELAVKKGFKKLAEKMIEKL